MRIWGMGECGIVFLDINMDGMDGMEVARQIKAECPKVHIVLVTAYVNCALDGYKVKVSQIAHYRDMQAVYERQGRKMHDLKTRSGQCRCC